MGLVTAVLQNHEGVRFKTIAIPHFQHEVHILRMERLSVRAMEEFNGEELVPLRRRVFDFWDREGKLYIYKERWEK